MNHAPVLDHRSLTSMLEGVLKPGATLGPWVLSEVYDDGPLDVALAFRGSDGGTVTVRVRPRSEAPAFKRTDALDVYYSARHGQSDEACQQLATVVAEAARRTEGHSRFSARPTVQRHVPEALNLALPSPCGQRCTFCSLETERGAGPNPELVKRLTLSLRQAAAQGTKTVRLNGIEPLTAPYLFELLDVVRDAGFERCSLLSTCRPLANEDFCRRYIQAMPANYDISIPIYGATAQSHDAIVGAQGSFAELEAATKNLKRHGRRGGVYQFTTVVIRANVAELDGMRKLARRWGGDWRIHLPFPNTTGPDRRYTEVAMPVSEVLTYVYPPDGKAIADLPLGEVLPCVAAAHQESTGHRLITPKRLIQARPPAGIHYRGTSIAHASNPGADVAYTAPTVPCSHASDCALAPVCPQRVYAAYAQAFGVKELSAISRDRLKALRGGTRILKELNTLAG